MIICITGMPGSGKTEAARMLMEEGFAVEEMGDELRRQMKLAGLKPEGPAVREFAASHKKEHGMDAIARIMADRIDPKSNVVISGLRNTDELARFREKFGGKLVVIEIIAPPETRFKRLSGRGRADDLKSYDEFLAREQNELVGLGQASLHGVAEVKIANTGTLDELRGSIVEALKIERTASPAAKKKLAGKKQQ